MEEGATALRAFSEQAGLQVGFESQLAKGLRTRVTKGTQTPARSVPGICRLHGMCGARAGLCRADSHDRHMCTSCIIRE